MYILVQFYQYHRRCRYTVCSLCHRSWDKSFFSCFGSALCILDKYLAKVHKPIFYTFWFCHVAMTVALMRTPPFHCGIIFGTNGFRGVYDYSRALNGFLGARGVRELSISSFDCRILITFGVGYWRLSTWAPELCQVGKPWWSMGRDRSNDRLIKINSLEHH